jgi:hypothetical protein
MLSITIKGKSELWDPVKEEFRSAKDTTITLEHSLVSISKWESNWRKPFFKREPKTTEEYLDYIKCMTITQNVPDDVYYCLSKDNIIEIQKYIDASLTATWFQKQNNKGSNRAITTSEVIYAQMVEYGIPFDPCQKWHISRLLTLIRVCSENNNQPKKMSKNEVSKMYSSINAQRRAAMHSKG